MIFGPRAWSSTSAATVAPATVGAPSVTAIAADDQDLAELDDLTGFALDLVDPEHILGGHPVLLAACFEDREHLVFLDPDKSLSGPAASSRFC